MELYDKPLLVIASETDAILPLVPSAVKPRSFKWHQMLGATRITPRRVRGVRKQVTAGTTTQMDVL